MTHLLFALILIFALGGASIEMFFNHKKKLAQDTAQWERYNKYALWGKIVGILFALATGFIGSQLYIK
jgi:Mn2+/Fe2+ NRAMP family transporter